MLEIYEFYHYVMIGFTFDNSAFSSAFFTFVGTHGFHVVIGLVWITLLIFRNSKRGLNLYNATKYYTSHFTGTLLTLFGYSSSL